MLRLALPLIVVLASACNVIGTQQGYEPEQPIPYSHALHAGELKIDCTYCHFAAERGRHAGIPPASVCMNCHTQVKKDSPAIRRLAEAVAAGGTVSCVKVHRLPDFVYFNHHSHVVSGGQQCQTCHGPVQTMVRIQQVETMTMGWCLDCHRQTAATSAGAVVPPTDCSACHY